MSTLYTNNPERNGGVLTTHSPITQYVSASGFAETGEYGLPMFASTSGGANISPVSLTNSSDFGSPVYDVAIRGGIGFRKTGLSDGRVRGAWRDLQPQPFVNVSVFGQADVENLFRASSLEVSEAFGKTSVRVRCRAMGTINKSGFGNSYLEDSRELTDEEKIIIMLAA